MLLATRRVELVARSNASRHKKTFRSCLAHHWISAAW